MKNNLFKKFLALFLIGTVLAGIGCKDYDDDIDAINKKLDDLETVTIAGLREQIKGIEGTVKGLQPLTEKVEALEKKLDGTGNLSKQLQDLEARLKAYADNGDQTTLNTAENKFALESTLNTLEQELTNMIDGKLDKGDALDLEAVKGEISSQIEALKTDADWLGKEIDDYLTLKGYAGTISQQASKDILEEIQKEGSDYQEAIKSLIAGATGGKIGKKDLDDELAEYLAKVDALIERVSILEKRIQSLVFVPAYADGKIVFTGAQYFKWDDADAAPFMLREGGSQLATLTFRVSPAALVKDIANKEVLSMVTEEVKTRAAAATGFAIAEVSISDAAKGEFKVTVSTVYDYADAAKDNKTQMVALHVDGSKIAVPEGQKPYDIDYTSAFIATEQADGNPDVGANFVLAYDKNAAKAGEEGYKPEYAAYAPFSSELKYTVTEPQQLLPGYEVMYKDGDNFLPLKDAAAKYAWTADVESFVKISGAITVDPEQNASNYSLKDRALTIQTPAAALIGNTVTAKFLFAFVSGDNTRTIQQDATHTINLLTDGPEFKAEQSSLTWNYAVATASELDKQNVYAGKAVQLTNSSLSAVEYNKLKAMTPVVSIENDKGIAAAIELTGTANRDTDPQYVTVTLTGDLSASAAYTVKAVYTMPEGNEITILCPVNVTGAPAAKQIAFEPLSIEYDGTKFSGYKAVENYCDLIWAQLTSAEQAQYVDQATFTTMVQSLAKQSAAAAPRLRVGLSGTNKAHLFVDFDATTKPGNAYELACEIEAAWGSIATFKASVTMTVPELEVAYDVRYNNGNPSVTTVYDKELRLEKLKLAELVFYTGGQDNVKVVFDFDEATKEEMSKSFRAATISSNNELSWETWNGLSLGIVAQLMYGEVKIGDPILFTPSITDPVAKGIIGAKTHELKVSKDAEDVINLYSLLTLNDINGDNVFTETGIREDIFNKLIGRVSFGEMQADATISNLVNYDSQTGVLTVLKSDFSIPNPIKVKIPVTFSYLFASDTNNPRRTGTIELTISQK